MALGKVDIFCPDCKGGGGLWVYPRRFFEVECRNCKKKWEYHELKEICAMLAKKAESDRSFQHWAVCLRIQMQHTINPFTGKCYA